MALQRPQPANGRIARCKIHTVRSQSPVSQRPHHRTHPPVFTAKQNRRQKRRHESISILGESANLAIGQFVRSGDLYRFRFDGNDKVKVNNSPFPHGPLPTIPVLYHFFMRLHRIRSPLAPLIRGGQDSDQSPP